MVVDRRPFGRAGRPIGRHGLVAARTAPVVSGVALRPPLRLPVLHGAPALTPVPVVRVARLPRPTRPPFVGRHSLTGRPTPPPRPDVGQPGLEETGPPPRPVGATVGLGPQAVTAGAGTGRPAPGALAATLAATPMAEMATCPTRTVETDAVPSPRGAGLGLIGPFLLAPVVPGKAVAV